VNKLAPNVQAKLRSGVNYNRACSGAPCGSLDCDGRATECRACLPRLALGEAVKLLIRGERGVGKSTLLRKLQGGAFVAEYKETPSIDVGTILWNYKGVQRRCQTQAVGIRATNSRVERTKRG